MALLRGRPAARRPATLALAAACAFSAGAHARDEAGDRAARVAKVFAAYDRVDSPGCTVGAIENGAFVHLRGYGLGGDLTPTVRDEFTQGTLVLRFERDAERRPSGFRLDQGRIRNLRFKRSTEP